MNVQEFFDDIILNSKKYAEDFDFDQETKIAIHKYVAEQLMDIQANPKGIAGNIIMSILIGYQLKVFLDKKSLEELNKENI